MKRPQLYVKRRIAFCIPRQGEEEVEEKEEEKNGQARAHRRTQARDEDEEDGKHRDEEEDEDLQRPVLNAKIAFHPFWGNLFYLQLSSFAYSQSRCSLDALSHCKQKSFNCKQKS